jgi:hypothetical protein
LRHNGMRKPPSGCLEGRGMRPKDEISGAGPRAAVPVVAKGSEAGTAPSANLVFEEPLAALSPPPPKPAVEAPPLALSPPLPDPVVEVPPVPLEGPGPPVRAGTKRRAGKKLTIAEAVTKEEGKVSHQPLKYWPPTADHRFRHEQFHPARPSSPVTRILTSSQLASVKPLPKSAMANMLVPLIAGVASSTERFASSSRETETSSSDDLERATAELNAARRAAWNSEPPLPRAPMPPTLFSSEDGSNSDCAWSDHNHGR